jgi:hypothetical protein
MPALMASACHVGGQAVKQCSRKAGGHTDKRVDGRDAGRQSRQREGESVRVRGFSSLISCVIHAHVLWRKTKLDGFVVEGKEWFKPHQVTGVHADQLAHATIHKGEGVERAGEWARTNRKISSAKAESSSSLKDLREMLLTTHTVSCGSSCSCDAVAATAVFGLALADL